MGALEDFQIGQTVELQDGRIAVVRFIGDTHFAAGDWVGVELEDFSGKNDGAVQGQRYFDCKPGRGMFIRPGVAEIIEQAAPQPAKRAVPATNGGSTKTRPLSMSSATAGVRRQSVLDPTAKRRSINAGSPTPSQTLSGVSRTLRSPSKSPTKQPLGSGTSFGAASTLRNPSASTSMKPPVASAKRASISSRSSITPATTTARAPRPSIGGSLNGVSRQPLSGPKKPANRLSTLQQGPRSGPSIRSGQTEPGEQASPTESHDNGILSPTSSDEARSATSKGPALSKAPLNRTVQSHKEGETPNKASPGQSQRSTASNNALNREIEDLKTKLRLMEKKRMEDRDKLKTLEKVQTDRDRFEGIIQKLQAKLQPQSQELQELRRQVKEAETRADSNENQQGEMESAVEMAALDQQMAEETAEAYRSELETLRQKHEELELEVEILREENGELGKEMSPEERTSQGWMQMERSNERLREALMRLRDMTQDQEAELKQQIRELEDDVQELTEVRGRYDETQEKLAHSESVVDDLRQQLETALGAEEMIEELTEKNMALTEQIDNLKQAIEELESLKELNDELEVNHIENEKQLQDEIDYQEALYLEQARRSSGQEETIQDLEYTASRFRELVANLQSDLEDMRASQQITETEANELSNRSKAMLDLNLRLQASATKAQVKAIEVEMGRLEAEEAADQLSIIRWFLPESYAADRDSVQAYLRIKRIKFKAGLLQGFVKERATGVASQGHEENVFAACDVINKLAWVSAMCGRFIAFTYRCSLEAFKKMSGALYDLEPVERALNGWIESLKREDLREVQCAAELQRTIALMTHLAEVHLAEGSQEYAEDVRMRALSMQSQLDSSAIVVSQIKSITQARILLPTDADEEDEAQAAGFLQRADSLVSQIRSAKVIAGKCLGQVEELKSRSLTLDPSTLSSIEAPETAVSEFSAACQASGQSLLMVVNEEGRTTSFTYDEVTSAISSRDSAPFSTLSSTLQTLTTQVQSFYALTTTLSQAVEFPSPSDPPPWTLLAEQIKAEATVSASHEKEVVRLKDEVTEKNTALALKDKALEEMSVSVEVLSKRINDSGGRREKLRELEVLVEASRSKEQAAVARLAQLEADLRTLESERDYWATATSPRRANHPNSTNAANAGSGLPSSPGFSSNNNNNLPSSDFLVPARAQATITALRTEISSLQATIRHLRLSAHTAALASSAHAFLATPLAAAPPAPTPESRLANEANAALRSMLDLVVSSCASTATTPQSGDGGVLLHARAREDRLAWRPARESARWQVGRMREEWEAWREWRDQIAGEARALQGKRERDRERERGSGIVGGGKSSGDRRRAALALPAAAASFDVKFPGKEWEAYSGGGGGVGAGAGAEGFVGGREVRIVRPEEWVDVERRFGGL